ncbi:MAG TPA: hypothetical protein PKD26_01940 [Pyrinomonadaceae bacterium]|nr:hypothetical protein [Pyrinomonadaceae bacterium]
MYCVRKVIPVFILLIAGLVFAGPATGQAEQNKPLDPNLEATLHVLLGSGRGETGDPLPSSLNSVARQLRSEFGVENVRLLNTYHGRIGNGGSLDYKGVSSAFVQEAMPGSPSVLEWRLVDLRNVANNPGGSVYLAQLVSFGARVPVRIGNRDESGKTSGAINYESVGLNLQKVSVSNATPTMIGTLNQPNSSATLYLVLTVKSVEK